MSKLLYSLMVASLVVAPHASFADDAPQRYVYEVWSCSANSQGSWLCDAPSERSHYESLSDCQKTREQLPPRPLSGGGTQWWQCYRLPTWSAAEPPLKE